MISHASRLDRPVQQEEIDSATAYYAAPPERGDVATSSCFVFRIGKEWLALPIAMLDEVVGTRATHALPHRRGPVKVGLVSVRGDIIVHVSLAGLLGIAGDGEVEPDARSTPRVAPRIVVLAVPAGRIAVSVDEIAGFQSYNPEAARSVPSTLSQAHHSHAVAIFNAGERVIGLLDGERVTASLARALS
jgi:chemotaxis-related protein WspD